MKHEQGQLIDGRYRLDRVIGAGGSAAVWSAEDTVLSRRVAVKFLVAGHRHQDTIARRFLREARIAAAVRHANVVEVFDFGTDDDVPYMVMELLEGVSLAERTQEAPPLLVGELLDVIDGVLLGLAAVHAAGIVHRDLKPENIYLAAGTDGASIPKIFDFGVSRIADGTQKISAATTVEGYLVGTPHYMSSEQARGQKELDERADIYSVGVVLYELLTGALPFDAELMGDLVIKIATETPASVHERRTEIGRPISELVECAMRKSPSERFESASHMREVLAAARADSDAGLGHLDSCASDRTARVSQWGAEADADEEESVPMPWDRDENAPSGDRPEKKAEWAADFDLPPRHRAARRWPLVAAFGALVLLVGGASVWYLHGLPASTASPPPPVAAEPEPPSVQPAPPTRVADEVVEAPPEARPSEPVVEPVAEPQLAPPTPRRTPRVRTGSPRRAPPLDVSQDIISQDIFRDPDF